MLTKEYCLPYKPNNVDLEPDDPTLEMLEKGKNNFVKLVDAGVISLPECLVFDEECDLFGGCTNNVDAWDFDLNSQFVQNFVQNSSQNADNNKIDDSSGSEGDGTSEENEKTQLVKQKITSRIGTNARGGEAGRKKKKPRETI